MPAKLTDLPRITDPQPTDELYIVRPAAGALGSNSIQVANFSRVFESLDWIYPAPAPGLQTLKTFTIPADTFKNLGDILIFGAGGDFYAPPVAFRMAIDAPGVPGEDTFFFDTGLWTGFQTDVEIPDPASTNISTVGHWNLTLQFVHSYFLTSDLIQPGMALTINASIGNTPGLSTAYSHWTTFNIHQDFQFTLQQEVFNIWYAFNESFIQYTPYVNGLFTPTIGPIDRLIPTPITK